MVDKKIVLCWGMIAPVLLILMSYGCAPLEDVHYSMLKSMRTPGEAMERTPEETSQAYDESCKDSIRQGMAFLEAEVIPPRIEDGAEINHRIRYAICKSAHGNMNGEIIRKVYYGGSAVFQDQTKYEFKRGTWTVDAFIKVPRNSRSGKYEVDTVISYMGKSRRIRNFFEVRKQGAD
jgi:hypothetical protein